MLVDEEIKQSESGEQVSSAQDYLNAIKELKENSVPRSDYEKLENEKKALLREIINGQSPTKVEQEVVVSDEEIQNLRKDLYGANSELNNLEYIKKTLKLREALIQRGERDPFLPNKADTNPSDVEKAEFTAKVYQECIDYAEGDSEIFTQELMRRTQDNFNPRRDKRR